MRNGSPLKYYPDLKQLSDSKIKINWLQYIEQLLLFFVYIIYASTIVLCKQEQHIRGKADVFHGEVQVCSKREVTYTRTYASFISLSQFAGDFLHLSLSTCLVATTFFNFI